MIEILIPFYKGKYDLLKKLLDSIESQKNFDFNTLLVSILEDDELNNSFRKDLLTKYSYKIDYKKHKHSGIAETRNDLLRNSKADYVMFCDQDDYFIDDRAFYLYNKCISENVDLDLIVANIKIGGITKTWWASFDKEHINGTLLHGRVFRRTLLTDNNLYFKSECDGVEDYYVMLLAFQLSKKIKYINIPLYIWAYNKDSVTHSALNKNTWIRDNYIKLIYSNSCACKKLLEQNCFIGLAVALEQLILDISKRFFVDYNFKDREDNKYILENIKLFFYNHYKEFKEYRKYLPENKKLQYYKTVGNVKIVNAWLADLEKEFRNKTYPLVSTIILSYNHEKYIRQTIESAINQVGCFNQEILISDDCSTDNTRNIIKEYADKYPNLIKIISPETNLGISQNYKQAIFKANGDYIALLEGDDYWLPWKLNECVRKFKQDPRYNFVFNGIKIITEGTTLENNWNINREINYIDEDMLINFRGNNHILNLSCCVFKKQALQNIPDILFDKYMFSEIPLQFYFVKNNGRIGIVPKLLSIYRHNDNGVWAGADNLRKIELLYRTRRSAYDVASWKGKQCLYKRLQDYIPELLKNRIITQEEIDELNNDYKIRKGEI